MSGARHANRVPRATHALPNGRGVARERLPSRHERSERAKEPGAISSLSAGFCSVSSSARVTTVLYRFGRFELDDQRYELRRGGRSLSVQRRVLDAMILLVSRHDRLVTKADLIAGPWGGAAVSESALQRAIMVARKTLAESHGTTPIQTVRGKGYRFVGKVETVDRPSRASSMRLHTGPAPRFERPFIGRQREIARLAEAFELAQSRQGGLFLVSGEPGIGKTRLLEHFAEMARAQGGEVWAGRGWDSGGAPALWPWLQAIRCGLEVRGVQGLRTLLGSDASELLRLIPELSHHFGTATSPVPSGAQDSPQARFRLFDLVGRLLMRAADLRPLVLLLDDLHAVDEASLLLLDFLAKNLGGSRVLLLASYRILEAEERATVAAFIAGPHRQVEKVALGGLERHEVAALLRARFGWELSEGRAELAHRATGGNPFLIEELGRTAACDGDRVALEMAASVPLSNRAAQTIRQRLGRIPSRTRDLLDAASIFGREFALTPLCDVLGLPPRECVASLQPALSESLVEACSSRTGAYRFGHQLIRETIYRDLGSTRRSDLHFLAANSLVRSPVLEDETVFQIAHHYSMAAPYQGTGEALRFALDAGSRARRAFAYELAVEHYQRALQLLELMAGEPARMCGTMLQLGEAQALTGRSSMAVAIFRRVMEVARSEGLHAPFAQAALACYQALHTGAGADPEFEQRLEEALPLVHEQPLLKARILVSLACNSYLTKPMRERQALVREALSLARNSRDPAVWAEAFGSVEVAQFFWTEPEAGLAAASEMAASARESGMETGLLHAPLWRAYHLLQLGRVEQFQAETAEHARLARKTRNPLHLFYAELVLGCKNTMSGQFDRAETHARCALEIGEKVMGLAARSYLAVQLMTLGLAKGWPGGQRELLEAESLAQQVLEQVPRFLVWRVGLARMAIERGDEEAARRRFASLPESLVNDWPQDMNFVPMAMHLAEIAAALDDRGKARLLYGCLLPYSGTHVVPMLSAYWGPVSYYLGILAMAMGDALKAEEHLQQARAEALAVGDVCHSAKADYMLARLLADAAGTGFRERCVLLLADAQRASHTLGLGKLAEKSNALACRLGLC